MTFDAPEIASLKVQVDTLNETIAISSCTHLTSDHTGCGLHVAANPPPYRLSTHVAMHVHVYALRTSELTRNLLT